MQTSSWEPLTKQIALASIGTYQQHISPKKGFSCPHRLLHGGESCSDYVKNLLLQSLQPNLLAVVKPSLKRFQDCTAASKTLRAMKTNSGFRCIVIPCCLPL